MWLRVMMVVAVTSLGLDAPTGASLKGVARETYAWCDTQLGRVGDWWQQQATAGWEIALGTFDGTDVSDPSATPMPNGTSAFVELSGMPAGILAFAREDRPATAADDAFGSVVDRMALTFAAEPKLAPPIVEPPAPAADITQFAAQFDAIEWVPPTLPGEFDGPIADDRAAPRTEKVTTALRLTGQAVQAWLSVLPITTSSE